MVAETNLYGAVIAVTSGIYSLWTASVTSVWTTGTWVMVLVGVVVLIHGAVLVTDFAKQLENTSGPLMIGYGIIMILNQVLLGTGMLRAGSSGMRMGQSQMVSGMGWDAGMVFLALLMLASGVIMTRKQAMDPTRNRM